MGENAWRNSVCGNGAVKWISGSQGRNILGKGSFAVNRLEKQ